MFRSLQNFKIGGPRERMPLPLIHALAVLKKAAAITNHKQKRLETRIADAIQTAADEVHCVFITFFT